MDKHKIRHLHSVACWAWLISILVKNELNFSLHGEESVKSVTTVYGMPNWAIWLSLVVGCMVLFVVALNMEVMLHPTPCHHACFGGAAQC